MDSQKSIDTILSEAIEIADESARQAYLDEVCGQDAQLRRNAERLIADHFEAGEFLECPVAIPVTLDRQIPEKPGSQIGPYKLLQQVGEGGMGVVYLAEQKEPVKRRVALKIIKPGMDTRQVIARFEAERQALALMDHPNIAKVLDAGATDSGRPYFVMELVNGLSITKYCDEQHLTPKERLQLFVPVCLAVQHAHQKGIIHRDLKPSNILVALYDGQAVPKIIDFGVAKAMSQTLTEKTVFTQLGQVVGTVEYMSPEQAQRNQLDIDTRSDIYSLGVVLYELLAGDTPFDRQRLRSAAFDEMLRIIREEEPPRPSTKLSSSHALPSVAANRKIEPARLSTLIRGELDWIVMKAIEKDRARRYATASALAAEIDSYMNGGPVAACPPSSLYRLRKFAYRNRVLLTTCLLVMVSLAVGLIIATWQAGRAIQARDRALAAEGRARDNLTEALTSVEKMLTRVADEKLTNVPFMEEVRRGLYSDALTVYQRLEEIESDDPEIALRSAVAQRQMANILLQLGQLAEARRRMQSAHDSLAHIQENCPQDARVETEFAETLILQGSAIAGNPRDVRIAFLQQAVEVLDRVVTANLADRRTCLQLGCCLSYLGPTLRNAGENDRAKAALERAESVYCRLSARYPDDCEVTVGLAKCLVNFGELYRAAGKVNLAEVKYHEAIERVQTFLNSHEEDAEARLVLSVAMMATANARQRNEHYQEAANCYRDAIEVQRKLVRDFPSFPEYRLRLSGTLMSASGNCHYLGQSTQGIDYLKEALSLLQYLTDNWPANKTYHDVLAATLNNLAFLVLQESDADLEYAEQLATEAIKHRRLSLESPSDPNQDLLRHYRVLADIQLARGEFTATKETCQEGLRIGRLLVRQNPDDPEAPGLSDCLETLLKKATQELTTGGSDTSCIPAQDGNRWPMQAERHRFGKDA